MDKCERRGVCREVLVSSQHLVVMKLLGQATYDVGKVRQFGARFFAAGTAW